MLMVNFSAVAGEIAKNIVLAGIGKLTIWDSTETQARHLGANYFLREDDLGQNVDPYSSSGCGS